MKLLLVVEGASSDAPVEAKNITRVNQKHTQNLPDIKLIQQCLLIDKIIGKVTTNEHQR